MTAATAVPVLAWLDAARPILDTLADTQADAMEQASQWCAEDEADSDEEGRCK